MNKISSFSIVEIHYGYEFHKVMDSFAEKQAPVIKMNYAGAQEHVSRAERNNEIIREQDHLNYHQLPYTHILRILVKYMVSEAPKKLNYFLGKYGVSKHYSPRMILHKKNLGVERHYKYVLG